MPCTFEDWLYPWSAATTTAVFYNRIASSDSRLAAFQGGRLYGDQCGDRMAQSNGKPVSERELGVSAGIHRRLAAVMGIDIVGYSILMAGAEEETHRLVGEEMDRVRSEIAIHHGREFSFSGDGLMAEFPSTVEALKCALRIHADSGKLNESRDPSDHILFRIGINAGEIVVQGERAGGTTVNIAARLEGIAEPGGIAMSEAVWQQVRNVIPAGYVSHGPVRLRNIMHPVSVYIIPVPECSAWLGMPALPRRSRQAGDAIKEYRPSLAVLPFRTLQKDQSDAYFSEGIIDDIIFGLGAVKDLVVVSRSSTQPFAGELPDFRRIGHDLDVRYVLHGSVRRAGDRLRIAVELAEAATSSIIWIERFDGGMANLFELQDRIAIRVATSIAPHLQERELARAMRKHPDSMTAYDLVLQATDLFHRADKPALARAGSLLVRAVSVDPNYGPAYSHLAALHMRIFAQGWSDDPVEETKKAAAFATEATERDPNDPNALAIFGHAQSYIRRDFALARGYLDRALDVGPNCPLAWGYSGLNRAYTYQGEAAIKEAEQALRLSPVGRETPRFQHYLALAHYLAGRHQDAVAWARISHARFQTNASNILCLIVSNAALGDLDAARAYAQVLLELVPSFRISSFNARTPLTGEAGALAVERLRLAGLPE
jgi:TolB-like protein/class 3 adenylate cyclase/Tfp pilus assembly protein PilF